MKLIRRRKKNKQTPFERATGFVKLGVKGLAAQRLLRRGLRGYRFTKRAVPLAGLGAIGLFISKKLRGGGGETQSYAGAGASAGTSATAAATAATGTPSVNGEPASGPEVSDALEDAGVSGEGPDTPKEAAAPGVGDEQPPAEEPRSKSKK